MKRIIPLLIVIASCSKQSVQRPNVTPPYQPYLGVYNSTNGAITEVTKTEDSTLIVIHWKALNGADITFDSVRISPNQTFTDNETVDYFGNRNSIGSGKFLNNILDFKFTMNGSYGGDVIFNGVKQ